MKTKIMKTKIIFILILLMGMKTFAQVGIGTNTPSAQLDVVTTGNTSATKALEINNSSAVEMVTVLNNGNVGIGTAAPVAKLESVTSGGFDTGAPAGLFRNSTTANGTQTKVVIGGGSPEWSSLIYSIVDATNSRLSIAGYTSGNEYLTVDMAGTNAGNVGIGTMAPTVKLEVNGTIKTPRIEGPSDIRFKENIKKIDRPIEKIKQLNGYTYDWKSNKKFPNKVIGKGNDLGVIAQEVEKIFPQAVTTDADGYKSVNYQSLIPVLIEAVKEQQAQIEALKAEIKENK